MNEGKAENIIQLPEEAEVVLRRKVGKAPHQNLPQEGGQDQDLTKEKESTTVIGLLTIDLQNIITVIETIEIETENDTMAETEIIEVMMVDGTEIECQKNIVKN